VNRTPCRVGLGLGQVGLGAFEERPRLQTGACTPCLPPLSCSCGPPAPSRPLLTKIEVAALVLGLEEAPAGLGVHVCSQSHQQLHIVLAATLNSNVQSSLACGGRGQSFRAAVGQGPHQACLGVHNKMQNVEIRVRTTRAEPQPATQEAGTQSSAGLQDAEFAALGLLHC
jgi:hypothetical protein